MYCLYYQAKISKKETWFFVAVLRSFEHIAFDRTLNKQEGIFEFFVPPACESSFLEVMEQLKSENLVLDLIKKPNRLLDPQEVF